MSFDLLAPIYGPMERVAAGGKMQRCRVAFLDQVPSPDCILMLGEGHGRFLKACLERFPNAHVTMVDASKGMIEAAKRFLKTHSLSDERVSFVHSDIFAWSPPQQAFDLISTHFFLDCFREDQLADLVPRIASAAKPGASWLLADFETAPTGWKRLRTQAILSLMYAFFRVVTRLPARVLTPPGPYLQSAGLVLHRRVEADWGLLKSEWWRMENTNRREQSTN